MANIIEGLYLVALKILNFFTWWRYKAKILSPGKEISLLRGVEDEKRAMKKAAPSALLCYQEHSSSAGQIVHVFPHMQRKIDVIIDVFETHEKRHLIEYKEVVNER